MMFFEKLDVYFGQRKPRACRLSIFFVMLALVPATTTASGQDAASLTDKAEAQRRLRINGREAASQTDKAEAQRRLRINGRETATRTDKAETQRRLRINGREAASQTDKAEAQRRLRINGREAASQTDKAETQRRLRINGREAASQTDKAETQRRLRINGREAASQTDKAETQRRLRINGREATSQTDKADAQRRLRINGREAASQTDKADAQRRLRINGREAASLTDKADTQRRLRINGREAASQTDKADAQRRLRINGREAASLTDKADTQRRLRINGREAAAQTDKSETQRRLRINGREAAALTDKAEASRRLRINGRETASQTDKAETQRRLRINGRETVSEADKTETERRLRINQAAAPIGPGEQPQTTSPLSDQRAGSVLIYNIYTSATDPNRQNTRINITNIEPARSASVHLFFVDGSTCSVADSYICLTPNQTASFLTSDLDPGTTGYLVAVAVDALGCPVDFNYLIGDEYVKFASGHAANLGAEAVTAIAGGLPACDSNSTTATLAFNGQSYSVLPQALAASNIPSRADGNDTLLIVNRIGGNLGTGAATIGTLFGILHDDAEAAFSFSIGSSACQFRASLSNTVPRTTPRFESVIPAGRSGWAKMWIGSSQAAITGAQINFNANAGSNSGAFNQGHNLHVLTTTSAMSYTIPVFPPSC